MTMETLRVGARFWRRMAVSVSVVLTACGAPTESGQVEPSASRVQQKLEPGVAASLAHPEYDLNVPTTWEWLPNATVDDIATQMTSGPSGYRLLSLDVVP